MNADAGVSDYADNNVGEEKGQAPTRRHSYAWAHAWRYVTGARG